MLSEVRALGIDNLEKELVKWDEFLVDVKRFFKANRNYKQTNYKEERLISIANEYEVVITFLKEHGLEPHYTLSLMYFKSRLLAADDNTLISEQLRLLFKLGFVDAIGKQAVAAHQGQKQQAKEIRSPVAWLESTVNSVITRAFSAMQVEAVTERSKA